MDMTRLQDGPGLYDSDCRVKKRKILMEHEECLIRSVYEIQGMLLCIQHDTTWEPNIQKMQDQLISSSTLTEGRDDLWGKLMGVLEEEKTPFAPFPQI